jgi:tetrahydromethanopterin S-methyltransferase subunit F
LANENKFSLYEAMLRVRNMPELEAFRQYLKDETAKEMAAMVGMSDDRNMHVAQGAVRKLTEIQNLIEESAKLRDKVVKATGSTGGFF